MASSTPLTKPTDSSVLNRRASSSASLMTTAARRVRLVLQFPDGQPENQAVDDREPLQAPVLRVRVDQLIDVGQVPRRCRAPARTRTSRTCASRRVDGSSKNVSTAAAGSARPTSQRYRICSAASRACRRAPLTGEVSGRLFAGRVNRLIRADHGQRRARGLRALVRGTVDGSGHRLFGRVRRQHAERHRHARSLRRAHDAVRGRLRDVVEVRRLAANQAAEADDGVETAGLGDAMGGLRQFVGARHQERVHSRLGHAALGQRGPCPLRQPAGDELVIFGDDQGDIRGGHSDRRLYRPVVGVAGPALRRAARPRAQDLLRPRPGDVWPAHRPSTRAGRRHRLPACLPPGRPTPRSGRRTNVWCHSSDTA